MIRRIAFAVSFLVLLASASANAQALLEPVDQRLGIQEGDRPQTDSGIHGRIHAAAGVLKRCKTL